MSIYAIQRTRIIGTNTYTYAGWEADDEHCQHSTITHLAGQRYGQISSRRLPDHLAALPLGGNRIDLVLDWRRKLIKREHQVIGIVFPEALGATPSTTCDIEVPRDPTLPALPNAVRYYTTPRACPGTITSRQSAYEVACWIDEILAEGEHITLNTIAIIRCADRLIVTGRTGGWTPAELTDLVLWPQRKEVNDALRTHYLTGATR